MDNKNKLFMSLSGALVVLVIGYYFLSGERIENNNVAIVHEQTNTSPKYEHTKSSEPDVSEPIDKEEEHTPEQAATDEGIIFQQCTQKLNEDFPWLSYADLKQKVSNFTTIKPREYTDGALYSTLPLDTLKVLAEANDAEAMEVYGTELITIETYGVSNFDHKREPSNVGRNLISFPVNKKIDFDIIKKGREFLYKAAVFGNAGALLSLSESYRMEFRERSRQPDITQQQLQGLIAQSEATLQLHSFVFQKDERLSKAGSLYPELSTLETKGYMQRVYKGKLDDEEFKQFQMSVEIQTQELTKELEKEWIINRDSWGLPRFPEVLNAEEGRYITELKSCVLGAKNKE